MGRGVRGTARRPYFHFNETEISVLFYMETIRPWQARMKRTYWIAKELKRDFWRVQAACRSLYRKGFLDYDATNKCWKRQAGIDASLIATSPKQAGFYDMSVDSWS